MFQMYHSAQKSNMLDKMTFVQNAIDETRRTAHMSIDRTNNGGSFVELSPNVGGKGTGKLLYKHL